MPETAFGEYVRSPNRYQKPLIEQPGVLLNVQFFLFVFVSSPSNPIAVLWYEGEAFSSRVNVPMDKVSWCWPRC